MFSSKDFEKCWFLYQSEGLPYNLSIEEFCLKQGVPVNEFNKMVQRYAQANTPHPSGWRPDFGIQGGDSKGSNATQWVCPNSSYHLHEQWRVYQTEELKLREPFEIRSLRKHT